MNITAMNLRSIANHERDHKGHVELAGVLDCASDELERLTAENERLRAALAEATDKVELLAPDDTGYITEYGLEEKIARWKQAYQQSTVTETKE